MEFITWVQSTGVHRWFAEDVSWFPYPFTIAVHAMGMGVVIGMSWAVDLRLLGAVPEIPLRPLAKFFPVMWLGFLANATTGVGLFITHPELLLNSVMWIKLTCIALGLVTMRLLQTRVFRNPHLEDGPLPLSSRLLAGTSILFWAGAITAGRLTAYLGCGNGVCG